MRLGSRREKRERMGMKTIPRYRVSAACFIGLLNYTVFGLRFIRACSATTLKCLLLKTSMNRFMGADSILSDHLDKKARVLHSCGIWDSSDLEHVEFLGRVVNCVADRSASLGRFQAKNAGMYILLRAQSIENRNHHQLLYLSSFGGDQLSNS